jgi:hypothetical protein
MNKTIEGELIEKNIPQTEARLIQDAKEEAERAMSITSKTATMPVITEKMKDLAAISKTIEAHRKETKAPVLLQAKNIDKVFNTALDPLAKAIRHLKGEFGAMQREAEEVRRKAAEVEAARIAKNAEKRAERAEKKGDEDEAENIRIQAEMEAEHAKAAIITQEEEKPKGVSKRKNWQIEVTDMRAFAAACLSESEQRVNPDMLLVNQPAVNKLAKALGEGCKGIPGVRVFYEEVVSVRSN